MAAVDRCADPLQHHRVKRIWRVSTTTGSTSRARQHRREPTPQRSTRCMRARQIHRRLPELLLLSRATPPGRQRLTLMQITRRQPVTVGDQHAGDTVVIPEQPDPPRLPRVQAEHPPRPAVLLLGGPERIKLPHRRVVVVDPQVQKIIRYEVKQQGFAQSVTLRELAAQRADIPRTDRVSPATLHTIVADRAGLDPRNVIRLSMHQPPRRLGPRNPSQRVSRPTGKKRRTSGYVCDQPLQPEYFILRGTQIRHLIERGNRRAKVETHPERREVPKHITDRQLLRPPQRSPVQRGGTIESAVQDNQQQPKNRKLLSRYITHDRPELLRPPDHLSQRQLLHPTVEPLHDDPGPFNKIEGH